MTWVVVGASAGLGRALAERLARAGQPLLLVASDPRDLEPLAADLRISYHAQVGTLAQDAGDHATLARRIGEAMPLTEEVDGLLFALGCTAEGDDGLLSPEPAERLIRVNFLSVVAVVGELLPRMIQQRRGAIVGFGSVAAARGRGRNVVYSASKRALESYFESLRHVAEPAGLTVTLYRLGYMDTGLAFGVPLPLPKADPHDVARRVHDGLYNRRGLHYQPPVWRFLVAATKALPWFIFKRLKF